MLGLLFILMASKAASEPDAPSWSSHINAGVTAFEHVRYRDAEKEFNAAVEIAERLAQTDRRLAESLLKLAQVQLTLGRYGEAERFAHRAEFLFERIGGAETVDTAQCRQLLAEVARMMGNYQSAEKLALRALAIRQKILGKTHSEVTEKSGSNNKSVVENLAVENRKMPTTSVVPHGNQRPGTTLIDGFRLVNHSENVVVMASQIQVTFADVLPTLIGKPNADAVNGFRAAPRGTHGTIVRQSGPTGQSAA
jgi:tetratricopeptide (TPR) repeat protein